MTERQIMGRDEAEVLVGLALDLVEKYKLGISPDTAGRAAFFLTCAARWGSGDDVQDLGDGPESVGEFVARCVEEAAVVTVADAKLLPKTAAQLYAVALFGVAVALKELIQSLEEASTCEAN